MTSSTYNIMPSSTRLLVLWVLDGGLNESLPSIYNVPLVSARLVRVSCWRSIMSVFMALNGW